MKAGKSTEFPIKIALRVRPRNKAEINANSPSVIKCPEGNTKAELQVKAAGKIDARTYTYDNVFTPESTQLEVYDSVVAPCLEEVLQGYNCTVFAYGQTGTGKTHTMEGVRTDKVYDSYAEDPDAGLIPRALQHLFEKLEKGTATEYVVKVSFLEIYNEEIFDLLSDDLAEDSKKLRLFEDANRKGSVIIQGLEEVMVHGKNDIYKILTKGAEKRRTAETKMNKASSRSHSVFSVTVHLKENSVEGEELLKSGKLYLVDLAGAENIGRSGAVKDRAREAGNINTSLLTLGRVISKLVERAAHIPYRESKLTRLLQDSLGGRTKTSIIATVSPAQINMEETQSTMEYAARAKNIVNKPEVNQKVSKRMVIKHYTEEIERLKRDLLCAREKDGIFLTEERYSGINNQLESQKQVIDDLEAKMTGSVEQLKAMTSLFDENLNKLTKTTAQLQITEKELETTEVKLEETATTLATTVIEKEEKSFLLDEQVKTEESLQQNAAKLLQVTETTTSHIDALHRKVQRKEKLEKDNLQASAQNAKAVDKEMSSMTERMAAFKQTQVDDLKGIRDNATQFAQSIETQLGTVGTFLESLSTSLQQSRSTSSEALSQTRSHVDVNAATMTDSVENFEKTTAKRNTDFQSETLQNLIGTFQQLIKTQQQSATTFTQQMTESCDSATSRLDTFASTSATNVQSLRESVLTQINAEATSINVHRTNIGDIIEDHTVNSDSAMEALHNQIGTMLSDFVATQTAALHSSVKTVQADLAQQMTTNLTFGDTFKENCATLDNTLVEFCNGEKESVSSNTEIFTNHHAVNEKSFESMEASIDNIGTSVVNNSTAMMDEVTQFSSEQRDSISQLQSTSAADFDSAHASVIDFNDQQTNVVKEIQDGQVTFKESNASGFNSIDQQLSSFTETSVSEFESTVTAVAEVNQKLVTQIKSGFKGDQSTGETPQQRRYFYPKQLPQTRPHDDLLAEFRNKKENEATESEDSETNSPSIPSTPVSKAFETFVTPQRNSPLSQIN